MTNPAQGDQGEFSSLFPPARPRASGPKTMTDLITLADPERNLMNWLVRHQAACLADIVTHVAIDPETAQRLLDALTADGFLTADTLAEPVMFRPNLVSRKPRAASRNIWDVLDLGREDGQ